MKPGPSINTRAALTELMAAHQLTRADVARLLGLKVTRYSNGTVDSWLSGHRNCPPAKLELLAIKAKQNEK